MCRQSFNSRSYDSPASQVGDSQTKQGVDDYLLLEFGIGVDLVRHGVVKDSSAPRDGFQERLGRVIDEPRRR
jgi:hypothetical protein